MQSIKLSPDSKTREFVIIRQGLLTYVWNVIKLLYVSRCLEYIFFFQFSLIVNQHHQEFELRIVNLLKLHLSQRKIYKSVRTSLPYLYRVLACFSIVNHVGKNTFEETRSLCKAIIRLVPKQYPVLLACESACCCWRLSLRNMCVCVCPRTFCSKQFTLQRTYLHTRLIHISVLKNVLLASFFNVR